MLLVGGEFGDYFSSADSRIMGRSCRLHLQYSRSDTHLKTSTRACKRQWAAGPSLSTFTIHATLHTCGNGGVKPVPLGTSWSN